MQIQERGGRQVASDPGPKFNENLNWSMSGRHASAINQACQASIIPFTGLGGGGGGGGGGVQPRLHPRLHQSQWAHVPAM